MFAIAAALRLLPRFRLVLPFWLVLFGLFGLLVIFGLLVLRLVLGPGFVAVPGLRFRRRVERREPARRLEYVEVGPAEPGQVAVLAVLPERPPPPAGRSGRPPAVVIGQPERVAPEPAGRPGALPPPGDRGVDDRPRTGQRPG